MRVVLRTVRAFRVPGRARYRQAVLDVEKLTIGRGVDQLIQISDPEVALAHAVIEQRGGILSLNVLSEIPVAVNGTPQRKTPLRRGDVLLVGGGRMTVEDLRGDGVIVLRLDLRTAGAAAETLAPDAQNLKAAGLRAAPASWAIVLSVLALTLFFPLLTSLNTPLRPALRDMAMVPNDTLWQPGPMHTAHQSIGSNCNACHTTAFDRVTDQACAACHQGVQHHVPVQSPARARFAAMRCADCHVEHAQPSRLVDNASRPCVACHSNLHKLDPTTTLKDVTDFGGGHPDFSLAMLEPQPGATGVVWRTRMVASDFRPKPEEHSNLKFSHQVHMDEHGVKSPNGDQVLKCSDCHQTDASGRNMAPIQMEQHCTRCHSLQFDENDSSTAVPHGSLTPVFTALEEHFSRMFLQNGSVDAHRADRRRPGGEQKVMTQEEQRRALEWTTQQALQAARELLEKRVCVECHTVSKLPGRTGFDQWRVEPVKLASSWMPRAQFNHAAHRSSTCTTCHRNADQSKMSSDVLMPRIKECEACHGGSHDVKLLASDCTMCHRLHLPGRGEIVPTAAEHPAPLKTAALTGVKLP